MSQHDIFLAVLLAPVLPAILLFTSLALVRRLDDRGMYAVFPFSWLPIVAGMVFCWIMLVAMEIQPRLSVEGVWFSDYWNMSLVELSLLRFTPQAIWQAWGAGLTELRFEVIRLGWPAGTLFWLFSIAIMVSILAWRSREAWRGISLFIWLTFTIATWHYLSVILLAWLFHLLNFWLLLLVFSALYFFGTKAFFGNYRQPL